MNRHVVVPGDNLSKIAQRYGLRSWHAIYYDPANQAFRNARPNPNLIYPGDLLHIPEPSASSDRAPATHQRPGGARQPAVGGAPAPGTATPVTHPQAGASSRHDEHTELAQAAITDFRARVQGDAELMPWRAGLLSFAESLTPARLRELKQAGTLAVLCGEARIRLPAQIEWQAARRHWNTPLRAFCRVNTLDDMRAIVVFIDELATGIMQPNTLMIIMPPREGPIRRQTDRAVVQNGNLQAALDGLRNPTP